MPDVGEKVKTKEGMAKVVEANVLENIVKVRIIEGEENQEEKLSSEIRQYKKEDIKRLHSHHKKDKDIFDDLDAETLKEIKELIKE